MADSRKLTAKQKFAYTCIAVFLSAIAAGQLFTRAELSLGNSPIEQPTLLGIDRLLVLGMLHIVTALALFCIPTAAAMFLLLFFLLSLLGLVINFTDETGTTVMITSGLLLMSLGYAASFAYIYRSEKIRHQDA
jgi:hypothetical protein